MFADYEDQVESLVELRHVYDGWSVAVLKDGTMVNRWADLGPVYAVRAQLTQEWIDRV